MGKDYSTAEYRRSYGSEYKTSYKRTIAEEELYDEQRRSYNTVSKKIGTRSYSKVEKGGTYEGLKSISQNDGDTVYAEGRKRVKISTRQSEKLSKNKDSGASAQDVEIRNKKTETSPPLRNKKGNMSPPIYKGSGAKTEEQKSIQPARDRNEEEGDHHKYHYIDRNSNELPIIDLGNNTYRNRYTDEVINAQEARNILEYVGYEPKPLINIKLFLILCLFVALPIKAVGPLLIFIWGVNMLQKRTTIMQKNVNGYIFRSVLPADETDLAIYKNRGITYCAVGIVIGILQFIIGVI